MQTPVKLYLLDIEPLLHETCFNKYLQTVSTFRQRKILQYHFQKDRALSLGAGLLINRGLQEYGLQESDMTYLVGENEKPVFAKYPEIHFNISHSGQYVICAFAPCEIGCDIEIVTDIDLEIAYKFFYHSEYEYINSQTTIQAKEQAFFRLWTLKESFMKITGLGMSLPLDSFCIYFDHSQIKVSQNINSQPYYFHEYDCESNYRISCCSYSNYFEDAVRICHLS